MAEEETSSRAAAAEDASDVEEDDGTDDVGEWESWNDAEEDGDDGGGGGGAAVKCLFCDELSSSAETALRHCTAEHGFDLRELQAAERLDLYSSIRLVNYIRKQARLSLRLPLVSAHSCIHCGEVYRDSAAMLQHMHKAGHFCLPPRPSSRPGLKAPAENGIERARPWDSDDFLVPTMENDALLFSLEEDDDVDDDDMPDNAELVFEDSIRVLDELAAEHGVVAVHRAKTGSSASAGLDVRARDELEAQLHQLRLANNFRSAGGQRHGLGHAPLSAQLLADELLRLRRENEELKTVLAGLKSPPSVRPRPARTPPTPHSTPSSSPLPEHALPPFSPPHPVASALAVVREDDDEPDDLGSGERPSDNADDSEDDEEDDGEAETYAPRETISRPGNSWPEPDSTAFGSPTNAGLVHFAGEARGERPESTPASSKSNRHRGGGKGRVRFAAVAEHEARRIDSSYFDSYSAFSIHREMLGDKVRTGAYQNALLGNPALLHDKLVLDLGCGTGILSLFAAQAGAAKVIAVDASPRIASVARQIAEANAATSCRSRESSAAPQERPVIEVVVGMIEQLDSQMGIEERSVDVLVSEWMGYCLLYESMLSSLIYARNKWLKPGGAMLPDVASMYVAGFGKGGTSLPFWEDVYGFDMSVVGAEVMQDAAQYPIVDAVEGEDVVTTCCQIQSFDLTTIQLDDVDFTSFFQVELKDLSAAPSQPGAPASNVNTPSANIGWCYGLVVWFDASFSERFCCEKATLLTTSPFAKRTHWAQTILTFKEPIALTRRPHQSSSEEANPPSKGSVGTAAQPAVAISGRISIARSSRHRSIDISLETAASTSSGVVRRWPVQLFDI
eukprot:SM000122S25765  [mRNA]  locus=s122:162506:166151:- [translate_table: standard]